MQNWNSIRNIEKNVSKPNNPFGFHASLAMDFSTIWLIYRIRFSIKTRKGLWKPFLCAGSIRRKSYWKVLKLGTGDVTLAHFLINFLKLKIQFTANSGPAHRNGFHYPIKLVLFAESDSVNNLYKWRSPLPIYIYFRGKKSVWCWGVENAKLITVVPATPDSDVRQNYRAPGRLQ